MFLKAWILYGKVSNNITNNITNNISNNSKRPYVFYKRNILYNSSWHKINGSVIIYIYHVSNISFGVINELRIIDV